MTNMSLRERVEAIRGYLPPVPDVLVTLVKLLNDEDADARTLAAVIAKDPSMSVNVLRIANSAFYGLPNKVKTIEHAVTMLGTREISSLCTAVEVAKAFKPRPGEKTLDLHAFWHHSVATAVLARMFCIEFRLESNRPAYLAGLMHDVGQLVLDRFLRDRYKQVLQLTYAENIPVIEAEKRLLGESHGTVGGWLMDKWQLPGLFSEVAYFHHNVARASDENRLLVAAVSLADQVARLKGFGFGGDETGIILEETQEFKIIQQAYPGVGELDMARFIMDLDRTDADIANMKEMLHAS